MSFEPGDEDPGQETKVQAPLPPPAPLKDQTGGHLAPPPPPAIIEPPGDRMPQDADVLIPEKFTIDIVKTSVEQALGWQVDIVDPRHLFLCRLSPGNSPLRTYNSTAPIEKQLREGDYIIDVNGCHTNVNDMMQQTRQSQDIKLVVQRPKLFTKRVHKNGGSLGLALTHARGCPSLCIEHIKEGALKTHAPDVLAGDRIVAVDGKKGDSDQLMTALMKSENPDIQFSRAG